jgi:predicted TIM-barrel fold metal-dependent hydrolase
MAPIVDVHTHIYPPAYIALLQARTTTPYIHQPPSPAPPRLIILPDDDDASIPLAARGRPIDDSYSSVQAKLAFMDTHRIAASVISLANPWLDWVEAGDAAASARAVNDEMESICATHAGRLYFFATLPVTAPAPDIVAEVERLARLGHARGLILGTGGLGAGLDDAALDPVWAAAEAARLLVFVHPHYGLPVEAFGPRRHASGHVLPLAMGFPLETTIAFARMYLAGVFARFPSLRLLLAHAGGAVPFLAGRLHSCVVHERALDGRPVGGESVWTVLRRNVWLDGVVYSGLAIRAAVEAVGPDRVLWGTDHPFFPPIDPGFRPGDGREWESVRANVDAVAAAFGADAAGAAAVLGGNAAALLGLGELGTG